MTHARQFLLAGLATALLLACWGYRQAVAQPVLREAQYTPAAWPAGAPPIRLVLLSDLHLIDARAPVERFARIVDRVNALKPDCVLVAGDLVSTKLGMQPLPINRVIAALARLQPRRATILVLGNHDRWRDVHAVAAAFRRAGMILLMDNATRCGPLVIDGVENPLIPHLPATAPPMRAVGAVPVLLSHYPDIFPAAKGVGLTLAGHTHCGQISLPLLGPPITGSAYGQRYACGVIGEDGRFLVVSGGIGTSGVPVRWNVPPDLWLITVGPRPAG